MIIRLYVNNIIVITRNNIIIIVIIYIICNNIIIIIVSLIGYGKLFYITRYTSYTHPCTSHFKLFDSNKIL